MVSPVAKRYGLAIFEIATEKQFVEDLINFLKEVTEIFSDPEVIEFLKNPLIPFKSKEGVIQKLTENERQEIKNFVELLLKKNRLLFVPEIYEYVKELRLEKENKIPVKVISAFTLNEMELNSIASAIRAITGGDVIITASINPELIGGIIVKYRDVVIDGSLKRYLDEIKKIIKKGKR